MLDSRDAVLKQLSSEVGIRTVTRANGDMAIYTDSGVTLFDKSPRQVAFQQTQDLSGGATGGAVYADGVPIAGTDHVMAISSGKLAGLVQVRDEIAPSYQSQLDEIARGLIETFAETDQSATPTLPPAAGLFTYAGGPGVPPSGTVMAGLAGSITVNKNADPTQGGNAELVRDGGISNPGNPAYTYNTTGAASYTDRIQALMSNIDTERTFDFRPSYRRRVRYHRTQKVRFPGSRRYGNRQAPRLIIARPSPIALRRLCRKSRASTWMRK